MQRIPTSPLTWGRLTTMFPLVHQLRPPTDPTGGELLQSVWDVRLLPALEAKGILAERIMSPDRLEPAHATFCVYHLLALDPAREQSFVESWREQGDNALELALAGKNFWVDAEDEAATPLDEDAPPQEFTYQRWSR